MYVYGYFYPSSFFFTVYPLEGHSEQELLSADIYSIIVHII